MTSQFHLDLSYHLQGMKGRSPSIKKVIEDARKQGMQFSDEMAGDIFNALFQKNPTLNASDNSKYSQVVRAALNSPRFQHIRMQTQNNLHWSAVGASLITGKLAEELEWEKEKPPTPPPPTQPKEPEDSEEESEEENPGGGDSEDNDESGNNEGDNEEKDESESNEGNSESDEDSENNQGGSNQSDSDSDSDKESDQNDSENVDEESSEENSEEGESGDQSSEDQDSDGPESDNEPENESDQTDSDNDADGDSDDSESDVEDSDFDESEGDFDEESEELDSDWNNQPEPLDAPTRAIEQALDEAVKELDEMMGGIQAGTSESLIGSKEEAKLADLYTALGRNPELARMIQMVGRMQISQHFLNGVTYAENQTMVDINVGRDLPNVLPQDLGMLLGNNEEFFVFVNKYNNNALLQRRTEAELPAGKGPMILCLDESGSMYGPKQEWAKAIAVAMYLQCLKERRQFAVVKFASQARALDLPKSLTRMDIEFMEALAIESYLGGGTNFQSAWNEAMKIMESGAQWKRADIVFLTDGFGNYNPDKWRADKEKWKIRLVSFFLDGQNQFRTQMQYNEGIREMIQLSDAFTLVEDFSENAEKQAFEVIRNKDAKGFLEVNSSTKKRLRQARF